jgi:hypothetical protein
MYIVHELRQQARVRKGNLLSNTSILFRKRMIDVRRNHCELITPLNRTRLSAIWFYSGTKENEIMGSE